MTPGAPVRSWLTGQRGQVITTHTWGEREPRREFQFDGRLHRWPVNGVARAFVREQGASR